MITDQKFYIATRLKFLLEFYFWLSMEGDAIVLSHYFTLSIHITTFTDEVISICTIKNISVH